MNYECCDTKTTKKILNRCTQTLQDWSNRGIIETTRTTSNKRRYNVKKYCEDNNLLHLLEKNNEPSKQKIIYCRVSSHDRKDDLDRQVNYLTNLYPEYKVIKDIGSGINFKRKGIREIIDLATSNQLDEVVITYKDRLCRIGYDLLEFIITKYSDGKITILNADNENSNEEITKDLIEIITVYSSKIHGRRSNKNAK